MSNLRFIFLDTETGGTRPETDALLEVGIVVTDESLVTLEEYTALIMPLPSLAIDASALAINGLKPGMFTGADAKEEPKVVGDLVALVGRHSGGRVPKLFGWNISFDEAFLRALFARQNQPWPLRYRTYDVQAMWAWWSGWTFPGLGQVVELLWHRRQEHRALGDARDTLAVMRFLEEQRRKALSRAPTNVSGAEVERHA